MHTNSRLQTGRRSRLWVLLLVALLAGLSACGSDDDSGDASGADSGDSGDSGSGDSGSDEGDAGGELDPDATLRIIYLNPSTIDPHRQTSAHEGVYTQVAYDRLVHPSVDGRPLPGLAESWEFSEDGTALTFHLREGAVFHDGAPVDAEAVKASLDRGLTLEGSSVRGDLAAIGSVEVVDDRTVQLNLQGPGAALPMILSQNAGSIISPSAIDGDLENTMPGAGPYEMVEYEPGTRMVFERFEDYWDPEAAKVARIEVTITTDSSAAFNALRSGQVDMASVLAQDGEQAESLGFEVTAFGGLGFHQFQMNRSIPPFDDERVRQAMNFAIDQDAIFQALGFGFGGVSPQPFPEDYYAFSDETGDLYPYDPDQARELLADAGFEDGFEFEAVTPQGTSPQVAEAIKSQLEEIGVTMNLQVLEGAQFAPTFYGGDSSIPVGIVQWTGRPDPRQSFRQLWSDSGFANPGRHSTPEFMSALEAASEPQEDEEAEAEAIQAVTATVMEQALAVPIFYYTSPFAYTDQVVGIEAGVSSYPSLRDYGIRAGG